MFDEYRYMELVDKFYELNKKKYPNINRNQFISVCRSPYMYIKEIMKGDKFEEIRIKHFGIFKVSLARLKYSKKKFDDLLKEKRITTHEYEKYISKIKNYNHEQLE